MIVKLLYHGLMPDKQTNKHKTARMCVSFSLQKLGMTDVYEKATVGVAVQDRRSFARSPGRK